MERVMTATLFFFLATPVMAQQDPRLTPFLPSGDTTPSTVLNGHVLGGDPAVWPGAPDLFFRSKDWGGSTLPLDDGTPKLYVRSLVLTDKGDAVDLAIRRAGPDNSPKSGAPKVVHPGVNLGQIYWQAWGGSSLSPQGYWKAGKGGNGRVAAIYARADGPQTAVSRPGKICLATTPSGKGGSPVERFCIDNEGTPVLYLDGKLRRVELGGDCGKGYSCLRVKK